MAVNEELISRTSAPHAVSETFLVAESLLAASQSSDWSTLTETLWNGTVGRDTDGQCRVQLDICTETGRCEVCSTIGRWEGTLETCQL